MKRRICVVSLLLAWTALTAAQERFIVMASTTSTEQSGLFAHLLPAFKAATGIEVRVVALGTGQALDVARRGDADVVFVHDPGAEEKFVAEGFGLKRLPVMYNDFVLIGPTADPAGAKGRDISNALVRVSASVSRGSGSISLDASGRQSLAVSATATRQGFPFISRGDKSGTHVAELRYWKSAGLDDPKGAWPGYQECGCGMGPALNIAASSNAYVLADRGTWLNFKNRADLAVLVEGDRRLFNQYGVMVVNPARHPHVKAPLAQAFADWVVSPAGQASIAGYRIGGEQLFFPNAN